MAIVGSAYVEIRGKDTFFERDIRSAVNKIKDVVLKVKADTDLSDVRKKIAAVKDDQRRRPLNLKADIDLTLVKAKLASLRTRHAKDMSIGVTADTSEAIKNLNNLKTASDRVVKLEVEADTNPAIDKLNEIHEKFKSSVATITAEANTSIARVELIDAARERTSGITANANTARAEAQLAFAARNRTSKIKVGLDKDVLAGLKGFGYTLTGALPAEKIKSAATGILANFESIAVGAAKMAVIAGSAGASLLTLSANALTLGSGLVETIGLLAMAPALIGATGIGIATLVLGFKGFGEALTGTGQKGAEALAKLPPLAQDAVRSLKGLGSEIRSATQTKFWDALGTSMQDMVLDVFPDFKRGMEQSGTAVGGFVKEYFNVLADMNNNGGLQKFFALTSEGFDNAVRGIRPFNEALGILAVTGAEFLPRMGAWFSNLGTSFNEWIVEAEKAGDITRWIEEAIVASQDLGDTTVGLVRIFQGLTSAARESGGKGLHEFAQGLLGIAETVQSEAFQGHLIEFFEGARVGSDALGAGLKTLVTYIGEASTAWSAFFAITGEIGGTFLSSIKTMFDGTGLGSGLYEALVGAKEGVDILEPSFRDLGTIIGDLGEIAAELFINMAPGLNQVFETVKGVVGGLKDGIINAMPVFNEFLQALLNLASGPLIAIATGVGNMLTAFAGLDPILQTVIMSLGLLLLALPKLLAFFRMIKTQLATPNTALNNFRENVTNTAGAVKTHAGNISAGFGLMGTAASQMYRDLKYYSAGVGPSLRETGAAIAAPFRSGVDTARLKLMQLSEATQGMRNNVSSTMRAFGEGFKQPFVTGFNDVMSGYKKFSADTKEAWNRHANVVKSGAANAMFQVGMASAIAREGAGRLVRTIGSELRMIPSAATGALKALPTNIGNAFREGATAASNGIKGIPAAYSRMLDSVYRENLRAQTGVSNLTKTFGPVVGEMHRYMNAAYASATKSISDNTVYARARIAEVGSAFRTAGSAINGAIIKPVATELSGVARTWSAGMAPIISTNRALLADLGKTVSDASRTVFSPLGRGVAAAATATTSAIGTMATSTSSAVVRAGTAISDGMSRAVAATRTGAANIGSAFQGIGRSFQPAVLAAANLGANLAGGFGGGIRNMGDLRAAAELTAGAIGTSAKRGLAGAVSGLSGALGGPWGLAIAGATVAVGLFAAAQAKAKAATDAMAATLDKQTGAMTKASEVKIAETWLDVNANWWDDLARSGSRNSSEIAEALGLDNNKITKAISNEKTRGAFMAGWEDLRDQYSAATNKLTGSVDMSKFSEEMLAPLGLTKAALSEIDATELNEIVKQFNKAGETADKAQAKVRLLADATGTSEIQAGRLAANYDVLESTTSSVSDKMSAFTANLNILSKGKMDAIEKDKALAQSTDDYKKALEQLKTVQNADGTTSTIDLKQYIDAAGAIDLTTQTARDLHTTLKGAATGIQETAIAAFQASRDAGDSMETASLAAVSAIKKPVEGLRAELKSSLGLTEDQINGLLDTLGLVDGKVVKALVSAETEKAVNDVLRVQVLAAAFAAGNWTAVLQALPEEAQKSITAATRTANDFKTGDYTATVEALNKTQGGVSSALFDLAMVKDGNYEAELKARNLTAPAVKEAITGLGTVLSPDISINAWNNTNFAADAAKTNLGGIKSPLVPINASDLTGGPVSTATKGLTNIIKPIVPITATDMTGVPVSSATKAFTSLPKPNVPLQATDYTAGPVGSANKALSTFTPARFTSLNANDYASGVIDSVNRKGIADKSFNIRGFLSGVNGKVREMLGLADGGVLNGAGVQKFADGGLSNVGIKAFARGGVEKHVAQITSRNTPIRIWSEPETHGEAYIPLNPAKRARSMKILEEVMRMFGVTAAQKFANGGFHRDTFAPSARSPLSTPVTSSIVVDSNASSSSTAGNISIVVNPSQGLSETQIGQAAMSSAFWQLQNRTN